MAVTRVSNGLVKACREPRLTAAFAGCKPDPGAGDAQNPRPRMAQAVPTGDIVTAAVGQSGDGVHDAPARGLTDPVTKRCDALHEAWRAPALKTLNSPGLGATGDPTQT